jgi:hypothetical protein
MTGKQIFFCQPIEFLFSWYHFQSCMPFLREDKPRNFLSIGVTYNEENFHM